MNKQESKELTVFPVEGLDNAVNERFAGADCKTTLSIITGKFTTVWNEKLPKHTKQQITEFVAGYVAGNIELRDRIVDKSKWRTIK